MSVCKCPLIKGETLNKVPIFREDFAPYGGLKAQAHTEADPHLREELIRTQIYLSEQQRAFLTEQA